MRKYVYGALLGLLVANVVVWPEVAKSGRLRATFFNVGQGDAIFLETPQGHQILIDGGPNSKVVEKLGKALPFWDKTLDLVILTHPDADHSTGLGDVFEKYHVEHVLWSGVEKDTRAFEKFQRALAQEQARVWLANEPQTVRWSQDMQERLDVLYVAEEAKQTNDTSIVAKLVRGEIAFLFPGDISTVIEQEMINQGLRLKADVLKVPHHGSKSSASESFLQAVSPTLAVIQVGKSNRYGHPAPEVLSRLGNIPILRTDLHGDIIIQSNGKEITIQ